MIITLTLNPSIDYIMQVQRIKMEDTLRARNAFFQAGGKGINVSRVLQRLDIENVAWGFCGGDTGNWLTDYLDDERVSHDFIRTVAQTRINPIITETETHHQLRASAPGGNIRNDEQQLLLERFRNLPEGVKMISMGGSTPPGLSPSCLRKLIEFANSQNIPCILDADGDVLKEGLQARPFLIKPNQYELSRLLNREITTSDQVIDGARKLIDDGLVQIVATSLGEGGAVLIDQDNVFVAKAPKVDVVSKIGAGDSMVAGLIKGLIEKRPLDEVLRLGVAAGTAAVMTPGNELCHKHHMEELLAQVEVQTPIHP